MVTPRNLCDETNSRTQLFTVKGEYEGSWRRKRTRISLHYFEFNCIQLFEAQLLMASRSFWMTLSSFLYDVSEIEESSTYFQMLVVGDGHLRSFTIISKSIGPSLVSCGTPAFIYCIVYMYIYIYIYIYICIMSRQRVSNALICCKCFPTWILQQR